jgi:DsbC/DsbD-like thiol-disulfide interchange protein
MMRWSLAATALIALAGPAVAGPDVPQPETRLVVGAGPDEDGRWRLAVEIVLPQGWHTYWRSPGDSGVPPMFDAAASRNLEAFAVAYPAPERLFDGFGTTLVYHGRVVLPVTADAEAPGEPVGLKVRFDYGYCKEICVPATAEFAADLVPGHASDAHDAALVEAAFADLPVSEADAGPDAPRITAVALSGADRTGHVDVTVATTGDAGRLDLFVEGPERWYLSPPQRVSAADGSAVFRILLDGMPKKAVPSGATLRLTATDGIRAVEAERTLD